MKKIAIIAGGGNLPKIVFNSLKERGIEVLIIGIKNNYKYKNLNKDTLEVKLGSLNLIFKILKNNKIKNIIFAGSIKRPTLKDLSLDFKAIEFLRKNRIENLGDDKLLKSISNYFENNGFRFIKWNKYCPNLFSTSKFLTIKKPTKIAYENLEKGIKIFKYFGKSDVGQSMIIQNKIILGLEAIEGTNNLIKRCYNYKRKGDLGILLKLKKFKQDERFDLPAIGVNTIKLLHKYKYEGIFIQNKYCLIIDKEKVIDLANRYNLFISCI